MHRCHCGNGFVNVFAEGCSNAGGGVFGGQIGYRWQASQWVFGLEAQGDWANLRNSRISNFDPLDTWKTNINGLGLFTGQIGYAWNASLLYFKGGAAVANGGMIFSRRLVALELRRQNGQVGVARSVLVGNTASRRIGPPASNTTISSGPLIPARCLTPTLT